MKRILTILTFVFAFCLLSNTALAQTPTASGASKFVWTISSPTLADANGYEWGIYIDGATVKQILTGVVCTGTASPFDCTAPIPAFTPGNHTAQLTAKNIAGESAKSDPLSFVFVVTPAKPLGFGIR